VRYKYKTSFSNPIFETQNQKIDFFLQSNASLKNLESLIEDKIDFDKNIDLLGVAFNAALINVFNKNGDGLNTSTALAIKDFFIHKPTNIEHNKEKIVGHIISSAISDIETNEIIESVSSDFSEPLNLSLGALIYSNANKGFAALVEKSVDPEEKEYMKVSASWELGFNDFDIAIGSENLSEAEIISEPNQIKEFLKYLKCFDGEGKLDDGTPVNRLVTGEVFPLGIGYTSNPDTNVKGLFLKEDKKKITRSHSDSTLRTEAILQEEIKNFQKNKKNISQSTNLDVINSITHISTMEKENLLEDFKTILEERIPDHGFSQEVVANVGRVIGDAIKTKSDEYEKELSHIQEERVKFAEAETQMKDDVENLKSQLEASQKEISDLKDEILNRKKEDAFNSRMDVINSEYELAEKDSQLLASELQNVGLEDSDFEEYKSKLEVMWAHKNKNHIAEQEKLFNEKVQAEVQKRIQSEEQKQNEVEEAVASSETLEDSIEEALDKVEAKEEVLINNNSSTATEEETLREKFQKAFSKENVTIKI